MQILCDKDPSVMSAALCALFDLVSSDVKAYKNLTTSFVSILKQVAEHRLPKTFDYHRTPAPFVQVLNQVAPRNQECFFLSGKVMLDTDFTCVFNHYFLGYWFILLLKF
jgi:hypothetical protein